jgi:hypothetical protein
MSQPQVSSFSPRKKLFTAEDAEDAEEKHEGVSSASSASSAVKKVLSLWGAAMTQVGWAGKQDLLLYHAIK